MALFSAIPSERAADAYEEGRQQAGKRALGRRKRKVREQKQKLGVGASATNRFRNLPTPGRPDALPTPPKPEVTSAAEKGGTATAPLNTPDPSKHRYPNTGRVPVRGKAPAKGGSGVLKKDTTGDTNSNRQVPQNNRNNTTQAPGTGSGVTNVGSESLADAGLSGAISAPYMVSPRGVSLEVQTAFDRREWLYAQAEAELSGGFTEKAAVYEAQIHLMDATVRVLKAQEALNDLDGGNATKAAQFFSITLNTDIRMYIPRKGEQGYPGIIYQEAGNPPTVVSREEIADRLNAQNPAWVEAQQRLEEIKAKNPVDTDLHNSFNEVFKITDGNVSIFQKEGPETTPGGNVINKPNRFTSVASP